MSHGQTSEARFRKRRAKLPDYKSSLIDSSPDNITVAGHRVAVAGSASEAREQIRADGLCLVILDRKLPDGMAEELLPEFRELLPRVDLIVVTGFADLNSTITALQQGAADYIIKPVNPDALRASIRRILERRRVEHELYQQHQFANQILHTAEAVVLELDLEGRIVRFNPYFTKITGWSLAEIKGQDWFNVCLPETDRESVRDVFRRTTNEIETSGSLNSIVTRDGHERQIRWSNTTLKDEQGTTTAVLAVGVDATDLLEAQEQALQSERLATIGQTMAALAHESRNALQRIQAGLEMLGMELGEHPTAPGDIRSIEQAADDLRGLLEEVRSYAAPIKLERTRCQLSDVWRWAWQHLELARDEREAALVEEIGDVDLTLTVDVARLEQVFRNLFENALAACPDPVRIEVTSSETEDGSGVEIVVRDNGPGLTVQQQAKVFDAFFTTKTTGTGLGMAIVQRIIEAHVGTICVRDDNSAGATFVMTFPRESQSEP